MDPFPPAHGPARHLDDLLVGFDEGEGGALDDAEAPETPDLPEVVEAVTGRARDLHRLADRLTTDGGDPEDGTTLSAVALLRAHAGAVDALAEHLLAAGTEEPDRPAPAPADDTGPAPSASSAPGPRGAPRSVG